MNIYLFDEPDGFDYKKFLPLLPAARRERLEAYKRNIDKEMCAAAFLLLRTALLREYAITEPPPIITGEHGKPYFNSPGAPFFNISHCDLGAVCAVSGNEIGVDIQDIRPVRENILLKTLSDEELDFALNSPDTDRAFAYLWSRKEAFLKQNGCGISQSLKTIDTLTSAEIQTAGQKNFFISASPAGTLEIIKITASDFDIYSQTT